ncbi:AAA family ATPase [Qipengyuania sp. SM2507]
MKLDRLKIEGLRGIPRGWPPIGFSDRGLIVYGPNGSGKSSIIDGLEFALGKESSLYPEARQGVDWERGAPHIMGGPPQARIYGQHEGQLVDLSAAEHDAESIKSWKVAARSATYVLRRHMLLKFIVSRPSDRYGSLESFFNLGPYTQIEAKFEDLKNTASRIKTGLQAHLTAKTQTARVALGFSSSEPVNSQTAMAKLDSVLAESGLAAVNNEQDRATRKSEVEYELRGLVAHERLTELAGLKSHILGLIVTSTYGLLIDQLLEFQNAFIKASEQSIGIASVELLRAAQTLIAEKQLAECPVCEQEIDTAATIASLEVRIGSDVKVTNAKNALDRQRTSVLEIVLAQNEAFRKLHLMWTKTMGHELPTPYQTESVLLTDFSDQLKSGEIIPNLSNVAISFRSTLASHQPLLDAVDAELASAGGARRAILSKVLEVMNVIDGQISTLESASRQYSLACNTFIQIERIHSHAVQARRNIVQSIVESLSETANEYYEFIHPSEKISQSALDVRQVGRGSVELTTYFHGTKENPLLYLSESHLDTLGLCYFLAARRLEADENPNFKLLVLDDVVHSVDADHRERIARLLKDRFSDHQLVIVTHDSVFYQRLRTVLGGQFEHLYIVNWTLEEGPVRIEASADVDRIKDPNLRNKTSPEELASTAGRFAEWIFRLLTENLQVAIQARFSRGHDLGSLWPPLASKIKKHKGLGSALSGTLDKIDSNQWVRNKVGAHYNEPESSVTPAEVREFAEGLSDLYKMSFCEVCSTTIAKIDDSTCSCECGVLKYTP